MRDELKIQATFEKTSEQDGTEGRSASPILTNDVNSVSPTRN